ncbi:hypothetical protein C8A01DRAFT_39103 [Parachaetomium inaequale]|uniref:Uncharacterized protein n=1 Tax=Parachaetomium inaequale TaxID=2588326 RepID=A0AAN6P9V7_9PEZI|nr:hypothetical protein C8A01DRAFT_39103 [Parachaetomium inaequale]
MTPRSDKGDTNDTLENQTGSGSDNVKDTPTAHTNNGTPKSKPANKVSTAEANEKAAEEVPVTEWSRKTFRSLLDFRGGERSNLFEKFPHMKNILKSPEQKAYRGLSNLVQNISWITAGPGTDKTFLLRFIVLMAMYADKDKEHPIKVLYFGDCYDAANKFAESLNRLCVDFGKRKAAIRLHDYELDGESGAGVETYCLDHEAAAKLPHLDLHHPVYWYYHEHQDQHSDLRDALKALGDAWPSQDVTAEITKLIVELYGNFLAKFSGVIATTPFQGCASKSALRYKADMCFVNDAGKVSELDFFHIIRKHNPALLVAIGNPGLTGSPARSAAGDAPGANSQGVEGQEGSQGTTIRDGAGCAPM